MQKPQQRKYHSSCNRSVHRGTAHGKQEVKVCKRKTPHLFWCGVFCPLAGMVHRCSIIRARQRRFRPLTGMVLQSPQTSRTPWSFRPLAGMVWLCLKKKWTSIGFRPLTGISCNSGNSVAHGSLYRVSVPLRGWYAIEKVQNDGKAVFAPLRGWYWIRQADGLQEDVFAPLRG